jgi:hypothetical protein
MRPPVSDNPLVPTLNEVAEALHRNAVERRELQVLKRLVLARLNPDRATRRPRAEATDGQEGANDQAPSD